MRTFSSLLVVALVGAAGLLAGCGGSVDSTGTGKDGTGTADGTSSTPAPGSTDSTKAGGTTSSSPAPYGSGCTYPTIDNPPECPPAYTRQPPPSCATIGLKCWYPGVCDGDSKGCWSTALLACYASDVDGGTDGGPATGHWVGAQ
jgi:hypothetical protein